jgi:hypothetical protein
MKATIIRSTVIALAVLAVSFSIKAQSAPQYSADIPFNFEVRGKQNPAGKYKLRSMSLTSPGAIGLCEAKSGRMRILSASAHLGSSNWDKPGTLTFQKINGKYILSEVSTPTFSLRMKTVKTDVRDVDNIALADRVVKINLN